MIALSGTSAARQTCDQHLDQPRCFRPPARQRLGSTAGELSAYFTPIERRPWLIIRRQRIIQRFGARLALQRETAASCQPGTLLATALWC